MFNLKSRQRNPVNLIQPNNLKMLESKALLSSKKLQQKHHLVLNPKRYNQEMSSKLKNQKTRNSLFLIKKLQKN